MAETTTVVEKEETLLQKLVTKEDPLHVHKVLGILCLISFIARFALTGSSDMRFKTNPEWTMPTVLLHLLLNLSAFEFKIPSKRIASGYRIWPEYRLHSLVFCARSLAIIVLNWYEQVNGLPVNHYYWANLALQMLTVFSADATSWSVKYRSGFSRELEVPAYIRFFFSTAQIFPVPAVILYRNGRSSLIFYSVMVIQGNAFLMTMRRKNIASHAGLIAMYALWLGFGLSMVGYELAYNSAGLNTLAVIMLTGSIVVWTRLGPRLPVFSLIQNNKYVMWILIGILFNYMRPDQITDELPKPLESSMIRAAAVAGVLSVFGLGAYKQSVENRKLAAEAAAAKKD